MSFRGEKMNKLIKSFIMFIVIINYTFAQTYSLQELRQEVLSENLDIKLQYERYVQAQRQRAAALGFFLPRASINLLNVNTTLAVLESLIPKPSNWFNYKSSQELVFAEKFTTQSVRLNILEGLTNNFVSIIHQEKIYELMNQEDTHLNKIYEYYKRLFEQGLGSESDVYAARRKLLQHRKQMNLLINLIIEEKELLLIAMNRSPEDARNLELSKLPDINFNYIPNYSADAVAIAIKNSREILSNRYFEKAARYKVSSAKWSFLSFTGIGLDYCSNIGIEKSKVRVIKLQEEKIKLNIENKVVRIYSEFENLEQRIAIQNELVTTNKEIMNYNEILFRAGNISFAEYTSSKVNYLSSKRELVTLDMQQKIKILQVRRQLGEDVALWKRSTSSYEDIEVHVSLKNLRFRKKLLEFKVKSSDEIKKQVSSIIYEVKGFKPIRVDGVKNAFLKYKGARFDSVKATFYMKDGYIFEKTISL